MPSARRSTSPIRRLPYNRRTAQVLTSTRAKVATFLLGLALLSSHAREARLARIDAGRLSLAETAEAAPWPGAREGLRFFAGTNRIDGLAAAGVAQPLLALDVRSRAAVRDDGMLLVNGEETG